MEKTVMKKVNNYLYEYNLHISKEFIKEIEEKKKGDCNDTSLVLDSLYQRIINYPALDLTKNDFQKRKRTKNSVSFCELCKAKKANGTQCTRRKKPGHDFCGTHVKGTPCGVIDNEEVMKNITHKDLMTLDIRGIYYYVDNDGNVYNHKDILTNSTHPTIIARLKKDENGEFTQDFI